MYTSASSPNIRSLGSGGRPHKVRRWAAERNDLLGSRGRREGVVIRSVGRGVEGGKGQGLWG